MVFRWYPELVGRMGVFVLASSFDSSVERCTPHYPPFAHLHYRVRSQTPYFALPFVFVVMEGKRAV